jgi:hypothetical protein
MILIAVAAAFTFGYAIHRAFLGDKYEMLVAIGGGTGWGCLVFCLDRLLVLGIDKFAGPWRLATQVLVRLPLALIIAESISIPFVLRVSETVIEADLRKQRRQTIGEEFAANDQQLRVHERQKALADLRSARRESEERLRLEPNSWNYRSAKEDLEKLEAQYRRVSATNGPRITQANTEISRISNAARGRQLSPVELSRIGTLRNSVQTCQRETARAQAEVTAKEAEKDEARREWTKTQTEALSKIDKDVDAAQVDVEETAKLVSARDAADEKEVGRIMVPNLVNQWRTLRRIAADPKHPDSVAVRTFEFGLHLLFLALEMTPVLLKALAKKGSLDYATAAVEFLDQERINLAANNEVARRQKAAEVMLTVESEALERWRDAYLQKLQSSTISTADLKNLREELEDIAA